MPTTRTGFGQIGGRKTMDEDLKTMFAEMDKELKMMFAEEESHQKTLERHKEIMAAIDQASLKRKSPLLLA